MEILVVKSPAKINLGLNIMSKREDGFHNLETIFYPLKIYDILTFEKGNKDEFLTNDEHLLLDSTNLILRAKQSLEEICGRKLTCKINLDKNIPIGAGLGGGSSNAASTLLGLITLFGLDINESLLRKIALQLGSDVPFFLNPVASYSKSRGEKLSPINFRICENILIVNPRINLSTKWAFSKLKAFHRVSNYYQIINDNKVDYNSLRELLSNDFEDIVFPLHPSIKNIKDKMYAQEAELSLMTGTGSTVFGIFKELEQAKRVQEFFESKKYFTFLEPESSNG